MKILILSVAIFLSSFSSIEPVKLARGVYACYKCGGSYITCTCRK